jgi:hypothetical protein
MLPAIQHGRLHDCITGDILDYTTQLMRKVPSNQDEYEDTKHVTRNMSTFLEHFTLCSLLITVENKYTILR